MLKEQKRKTHVQYQYQFAGEIGYEGMRKYSLAHARERVECVGTTDNVGS